MLITNYISLTSLLPAC